MKTPCKFLFRATIKRYDSFPLSGQQQQILR